MVSAIKPDRQLDASGMDCPLVLAKTKMALQEMNAGQILEVITTDACTEFDLPAWAEKTRKEIVQQSKKGSTIRFYIKKL